ncbi:MAG: 23S rRNA (adenine(2503)-C(2))-methyltransferase RlmN [Bacillota bacterium]|nr:23S rRNA (adenine(2503)-C(2))-methyltransferase RlmN [Bacillota bacterium]
MKNLLDLTIEEMKQFAVELGEKPFRGRQIFTWLHRGVRDFREMTDLSLPLRDKLTKGFARGDFRIGGCRVAGVQEDSRDKTRKFLFRVGGADEEREDNGGDFVEAVFMKYRYGNTLCVSSQIGCRMGCRFCAGALGGFVRNLSPGEMLDQVLAAERYLREKGEADEKIINHVVVMGMGEPFDNYDNVAGFLRLLHHEAGKNMSYRNMTVSTSGIIPMIYRFAEDFPQVNLAISLHCLTDEGRSAIMPVNRRYPLDELLEAAHRYTDKTHRRITFEYTLIRGENDTAEDAALIGKKLGGMLCHVNLIPLNRVEETGYDGSTRKRAEEFAAAIESAGIPATVRRELGGKIDGACGQLRRISSCPTGTDSL